VSTCTTVTLSGIVGAGKSSAAKAIVEGLRAAGCPAQHIRFQEFMQLWPRRRRGDGLAPPKRAASANEAGKERWAGYQRRRLTMAAAAGYVARTVLFRMRLKQRPGNTVLVFDRYFYDSLVHFDLRRPNAPLALLMQAIPAPTVAALLVVHEATIRDRRSHYSAEYARQAVHGYEELRQLVPTLLVARTDEFDSVGELADHVVASVLARQQQHG
jgi:thymidylate kinase